VRPLPIPIPPALRAAGNGRDGLRSLRGFARRGAPCEPRDGAAYSPDNRPCGPLSGCAGAHPGRSADTQNHVVFGWR
jgi:hypothetical protein